MAAFALNVRTIVSHPNVMGFKPGSQTKRSTPRYLEPDFLKSLGAKRETVECRGVDDEVRGRVGEGREGGREGGGGGGKGGRVGGKGGRVGDRGREGGSEGKEREEGGGMEGDG